MKEKLEQRLEQLRVEWTKGKAAIASREEMRQRLAELDTQAPELALKMNRIGGAIQAIEEVLGLREVA